MDGRLRRPFWLPALNFYILTAVVTAIVFFVVFELLREDGEENSFLPACLVAGTIFCAAVFLREFVLRNARKSYLAAQRQLDLNIKSLTVHKGKISDAKISLEQNQAILKNIKKKSDAAKILQNLPDTHREVFEICTEYLTMSANQIKNIGAGSPRLASFRRGREVVKQLHRFHLLEWMQAETKNLLQEAKIRVTISEKLNAAQKALDLIGSALSFYPNEPQLTESETALKQFVFSIKVFDLVGKAERAVFDGELATAAKFYRNALVFLDGAAIQTDEKEIIAEKINLELKKISLPNVPKK